jgi:hypothetical protein
MTKLKRTPRVQSAEAQPLDANDRARLFEAARVLRAPFFPVGTNAAAVRTRPDGTLVFELYSRNFPLNATPIVVVEDVPAVAPAFFGDMGQIWFGGPLGLKLYSRVDLDAETLTQVGRMLDAFRRDGIATFAYRQAAREGTTSRQRFEEATRIWRTFTKNAAARRDLTQLASELADRYAPKSAVIAQSTADANTPVGASFVWSGAEDSPLTAPAESTVR